MKLDQGLAVVHLFCRISARVDRDAALAAVHAARSAESQVVTAAILGHKADLVIMVLAKDLRVIHSLQIAIGAAGLEVVQSYISITEVSEYAKGLPTEQLNARLYPELPPEGKQAFCFYPMSKRREAHANWFATDFERRREMMMEHGRSGRAFAGRIVQLITGSTGLDDYEWGVTLFAVNPETLKDVVYTMRFDEGSALYGEFGPFYAGYVTDLDELI
jgi:chlorite dismutase